MTENVTEQLWFVTGASSGFGRALTEAALSRGDIVVGAARRTEALSGLVASHPGRLEVLRLDVTDSAAVTAGVRDVLDRHGRIDVLVNNAGKTTWARRRKPMRRSCARCSSFTFSRLSL
jgi:NADP-dependent 3-hydroxy acid dehydrogenase YdfG